MLAGYPISTFPRTLYFPYTFKGKACFLIEGSETDTMSEEGSICTKCGPCTSLYRTNALRIIEHMATHILHDSIPPTGALQPLFATLADVYDLRKFVAAREGIMFIRSILLLQ